MARHYSRNKVRTFLAIIRQIENWPTAAHMRLRKQLPGLRLLNFRNGLNVICRAGCRDWDVLHELYFAGSYGRALETIRSATSAPLVLDLGGNIGSFSLLAASLRPDVIVHAYEPGPPNQRIFSMNRLANAPLAERIHLHPEAVGAATTTAQWFFDESNPGGSSLYGTTGQSIPVAIRAFAEVLAAFERPVTLAKIDIEGAEFDLVRGTPRTCWEKVGAIALELHDDPAGEMSHQQFLDHFRSLGFQVEEESVCSYFLHR